MNDRVRSACAAASRSSCRRAATSTQHPPDADWTGGSAPSCGRCDRGRLRSRRSSRPAGAGGLSVSEDAGGGGADLTAAAVALIALGSLGASVPEVEAGLMAGWVLERAGARLPDGIVTASVCDRLEVRPNGAEFIVSGE